MNIILITVLIFFFLYLIFRDEKLVARKEYLLWLDKRIAELETECDELRIITYRRGIEYDSSAEQKLLSRAGKLKAYKEIRDYINTH
jgi:hypothetical protein